MNLEPYQKKAIAKLSPCKRGILKCPAGGGKTIIAQAALRMTLSKVRRSQKVKILWLANTIDQLEQAKTAQDIYPEIAQLAEIDYKCPAGVNLSQVSQYKHVIVDECQHAPAESWRAIIEQIPSRWGLSATPEREGATELLGDIVCEITRAEVLQTGRLCDGTVYWHDLKLPSIVEEAKAQGEEAFQKMWRKFPPWLRKKEKEKELRNRAIWQAVDKIAIQGGTKRNLRTVKIMSEAVAAGDVSMVLCRTIDHCAMIAGMLPFECVVLTSRMTKAKRKDAIEKLRTGEIMAAAATSLADEGLDVPKLTTLVMAAPSRSFRLAVQRTGRALRATAGKEFGRIHDFNGEEHYMLAAQARRRNEVYADLGYTQEDYIL